MPSQGHPHAVLFFTMIEDNTYEYNQPLITNDQAAYDSYNVEEYGDPLDRSAASGQSP